MDNRFQEVLVEVGPLKKVLLFPKFTPISVQRVDAQIQKMALSDGHLSSLIGSSRLYYQRFNPKFDTYIDLGLHDNVTNGAILKANPSGSGSGLPSHGGDDNLESLLEMYINTKMSEPEQDNFQRQPIDFRDLPDHPPAFRGHPSGFRGNPGLRGNPSGPRGNPSGPRGHPSGFRGQPQGFRGHPPGLRGHPSGFRGNEPSFGGPPGNYPSDFDEGPSKMSRHPLYTRETRSDFPGFQLDFDNGFGPGRRDFEDGFGAQAMQGRFGDSLFKRKSGEIGFLDSPGGKLEDEFLEENYSGDEFESDGKKKKKYTWDEIMEWEGEELGFNWKNPRHVRARYAAAYSLGSKQPVQALCEHTQVCGWEIPKYELIWDRKNRKFFKYSVRVNKKTYVPDRHSMNKKQAKVYAAIEALYLLGVTFVVD